MELYKLVISLDSWPEDKYVVEQATEKDIELGHIVSTYEHGLYVLSEKLNGTFNPLDE